MKENRGWFLVVDGGCGRLMQCMVVPPGRLHVEERAVLDNPTIGLEHGRPSSLKGKSGNSYASRGHEAEEELHRFAKKIAAWLDREIARFAIVELAVFCTPRLLGELRKVWGSELEQRIRIRQADLTSLSPAELARHPAVRSVTPGQSEDWMGAVS